jgi:glucose-6-phosphate 1-dehydrogenase
MNECTIIILGATGDLAKRKLIPAIYQLLAEKKIEKILVVGAAFEQEDARNIIERAKQFIPKLEESVWQQLLNAFHYQQLDFNKKVDFNALATRVNQLERDHNLQGNRIIYLAAASTFFCEITQHLATSGLAKKVSADAKPWYRIIYEKPFGNNLQSAHEINECIASVFDESQIYRIDHYLTKELVSNITLIRFTNCIFEPLWNNRYIDNVQIILSEDIGVEGRGGYYDKYGALKDVVQNHMLELLALIGMETPEKLTGEYVAIQRAKVLEKVRFVDAVLGQYDGYQQVAGVAPNSKTETFAALYMQIHNPRWAGVPFYLKTGKCLNKQETVIHIKFKQVDCLLTRDCPSDSNYLTIKIAPEATFSLSLNAKKIGQTSVMPIKMEFCHSCLFADKTPQAHEILLLEVMRGERSISVRFDEIEYSWKLIDHIEAIHLPVHPYEQGSEGPEALKEFERKHGMRWRS